MAKTLICNDMTFPHSLWAASLNVVEPITIITIHHSPCPNNLWCVFNLFLLPSALLAELHLTPTIFDMTVRCEMTSQPQLNWSDNLANTADIKRSGENGLPLLTLAFIRKLWRFFLVSILSTFNNFSTVTITAEESGVKLVAPILPPFPEVALGQPVQPQWRRLQQASKQEPLSKVKQPRHNGRSQTTHMYNILTI